MVEQRIASAQDGLRGTIPGMAALTTKRRKRLPKSSFAVPGKRAYPINDPAHAANALSRVAQHGTPAQKAAVARAVRKRYPGLAKRSKAKVLNLAVESATFDLTGPKGYRHGWIYVGGPGLPSHVPDRPNPFGKKGKSRVAAPQVARAKAPTPKRAANPFNQLANEVRSGKHGAAAQQAQRRVDEHPPVSHNEQVRQANVRLTGNQSIAITGPNAGKVREPSPEQESTARSRAYLEAVANTHSDYRQRNMARAMLARMDAAEQSRSHELIPNAQTPAAKEINRQAAVAEAERTGHVGSASLDDLARRRQTPILRRLAKSDTPEGRAAQRELERRNTPERTAARANRPAQIMNRGPVQNPQTVPRNLATGQIAEHQSEQIRAVTQQREAGGPAAPINAQGGRRLDSDQDRAAWRERDSWLAAQRSAKREKRAASKQSSRERANQRYQTRENSQTGQHEVIDTSRGNGAVVRTFKGKPNASKHANDLNRAHAANQQGSNENRQIREQASANQEMLNRQFGGQPRGSLALGPREHLNATTGQITRVEPTTGATASAARAIGVDPSQVEPGDRPGLFRVKSGPKAGIYEYVPQRGGGSTVRQVPGSPQEELRRRALGAGIRRNQLQAQGARQSGETGVATNNPTALFSIRDAIRTRNTAVLQRISAEDKDPRRRAAADEALRRFHRGR